MVLPENSSFQAVSRYIQGLLEEGTVLSPEEWPSWSF